MSDTANGATNWILAICAIIGAVVAIGGALFSWWKSFDARGAAGVSKQHKDAAEKMAKAAEGYKNAAERSAKALERIADKAEEQSRIEVTLSPRGNQKGRMNVNAVLHGNTRLTVDTLRVRCNSGRYYEVPGEDSMANSLPWVFEGNGDEHKSMGVANSLVSRHAKDGERHEAPYTFTVMLETTTALTFESNPLTFNWNPVKGTLECETQADATSAPSQGGGD